MEPTGSGATVISEDGVPALFAATFGESKNPMALVNVRRQLIDCNGAMIELLGYEPKAIMGRPIYRLIDGGPLVSPSGWKTGLAQGRFIGDANLIRAAGDRVAVQWAATTEVVTGRRLTLFVALNRPHWAERCGRGPSEESRPPSAREREVVALAVLGYSGPEIATQLHIGTDTVRGHVRNAMVKLDARSHAHLIAKTLGDGLGWK